MARYLTELIGTYFLVLTIGCASIGAGEGVIAPLAVGGVLIALVYGGWHISGAHYNPAVTLAVWLRGRLEAREIAPYWMAQLVAGFAAALTVRFLRAGDVVTAGAYDLVPSLVAELLFTFALAFVFLQTATSKTTEGNSFYGLAIGLTVMAGAFAVGDVSGGAFNPAVAFGLAAMGLVTWPSLWIYLVAAFLGGAAAAFAFRVTNPGAA